MKNDNDYKNNDDNIVFRHRYFFSPSLFVSKKRTKKNTSYLYRIESALLLAYFTPLPPTGEKRIMLGQQ